MMPMPAAASSRSRSAPPRLLGLTWEGRWGRWADAAVHVLAAMVGEIEVAPTAKAKGMNIVDNVLHEFGAELQKELPPGAAVLSIHDTGSQVAGRFRIKAALVCEQSVCLMLQQRWQRRPLCGGMATVTWLSVTDTASPAHNVAVRRALSSTNDKFGFALDLPLRWAPELTSAAGRGKSSLALSPGSHWWDFAARFGDLVHAEMRLVSAEASSARLIVRFAEPFAARAMAETLMFRYLYNPSNRNVDDTYAVTCAVGSIDDLRQPGKMLAQPRQRQAPSRATPAIPVDVKASIGAGFVLKRCGGAGSGEQGDAGPPIINLTPARPSIVVGREDCDVLLKRAHVSKAHALLELRTATDGQGPDGHGWTLRIQDTSANGTWANGKRLESGVFAELKVGDRISFLPASSPLYPDALVYEVALPSPFDIDIAQKAVNTAAERKSPRQSGQRRSRGDAQQSPAVKHARMSEVIDLEAEMAPRISTSNATAERRRQDVGSPVGRAKPRGSAGLIIDEIKPWLASLDGGSLVGYQRPLETLFDSVSQIRELYADRLQDFYEDVGVQDPNHRLAFATALRVLRKQACQAAVP